MVHKGEGHIIICFDPNDVLEYATLLSLPIQVTQEKDSRSEGISFVLQYIVTYYILCITVRCKRSLATSPSPVTNKDLFLDLCIMQTVAHSRRCY